MTLVVVGLDLAAGRGRTELAVVTRDASSSLPRFDLVSHTEVSSDDEIIAAVGGLTPAVIAIDAPLSLPRAVADALLGRSTAGALTSPYTRAAERSSIWTKVGVRPLPVSFLGGLTFRAITLVPRLRCAVPTSAIIEVFPTASLRLLSISSHDAAPTHRQRAAKTAVSARERIQRAMASHISGLPDPSQALFTADLLDALAAALTGLAYARGDYLAVGDQDEGQIILPRATL